MIDAERFDSLCKDPPKLAQGIGTYQEKSVHAVLKHCCESDPAFLEVPYLGYVADVKNGQTIREIQSANFYALREKLRCFLDSGCTVCLLYPIPAVRILLTLDPASGEVISRRRAGRHGLPSDLLYELSYLRDIYGRENFSVTGILMEVEETRVPGMRRGRAVTSRQERFPVRMLGEICVEGDHGLAELLPPLPPGFTAAALAHAARLSARRAGMILSFLLGRGILSREKVGRSYRYSLTVPVSGASDGMPVSRDSDGDCRKAVAETAAGKMPKDASTGKVKKRNEGKDRRKTGKKKVSAE